VSAALYEPFGLAILEAAQAGCALVLSDLDSFRELWTDAALFAPANDEEAFAAAIGRLLSDPDLRADYAHAAQNRARAFGLDAFVDDMLNHYRSLLAGGGARDNAA
jgi:glycosyltransferase involved in cell wall biosynthesis